MRRRTEHGERGRHQSSPAKCRLTRRGLSGHGRGEGRPHFRPPRPEASQNATRTHRLPSKPSPRGVSPAVHPVSAANARGTSLSKARVRRDAAARWRSGDRKRLPGVTRSCDQRGGSPPPREVPGRHWPRDPSLMCSWQLDSCRKSRADGERRGRLWPRGHGSQEQHSDFSDIWVSRALTFVQTLGVH